MSYNISDRKFKDWQMMKEQFRQEFESGCAMLRMQKDWWQSHRSVWQYIDYFNAQCYRMMDEAFGRGWNER